MEAYGSRILMISPTPTHPQDAGNRARIFQLSEQIRSMGYDLHFLYYQMEDMDLNAMEQYWGNRLTVFTPGTGNSRAGFSCKNLLLRFGGRWGVSRSRRWDLNNNSLEMGEWRDRGFERAVQRIQAVKKFPVVWVEYVFISKILDCFDLSVKKIIDTHDVFSHRHRYMAEHGIKPEWFSSTPEMEREGLKKADHVIAIQERDADFFRSLGMSQVTTIGHFTGIHAAKKGAVQKRILFVGSHNPINLKTWDFFERDILKLIKKRVPSSSVWVVGNICERIPDNYRYQKLGVRDDLHAIYGSSSLAVNPVIWGTGLKIKIIEALAHGCPVVTTRHGLLGIEETENQGALVGETPGEFAECVSRLLSSSSCREEQSFLGREFIKDYVRKNRQRLKDVLTDDGVL